MLREHSTTRSTSSIRTSTEKPKRRAFVTLVARGSGHYIAPTESHAMTPNYLLTVLPLLCSFIRVRSQYPLLVLAANLSQSEETALLAYGATSVLPLEAAMVQQLSRIANAGYPHTMPCILQQKGGWMVSGRTDFQETVLKLAIWSLFDHFDEVAYLDADSIFLRHPDSAFDLLTSSRYSRHERQRYLQASECNSRSQSGAALSMRPLCDHLEFVAPESGRFHAARRQNTSWSPCHSHGWQSGFVVMRPSSERLQSLLARLRGGNFSLFTRTEQDVLDSEFNASDHCTSSGTTSCIAHAFLSQSLVRSIVLHHKLHARIAEGNRRTARADIWWRDQLLLNLTVVLCPGPHSALAPALHAAALHSVSSMHMGQLALRRAGGILSLLKPLLDQEQKPEIGEFHRHLGPISSISQKFHAILSSNIGSYI